jgi:hypothetical protein
VGPILSIPRAVYATQRATRNLCMLCMLVTTTQHAHKNCLVTSPFRKDRKVSPTSMDPSADRSAPSRPPGAGSALAANANRARSAASDQALHQMKNELAPLRLSPEVRSHSPSTSTQLRQGGSSSPVVCERKVSESDFRDVHRVQLLRPDRRASDDSGLRTLGPANETNSPSSRRPSPACSNSSSDLGRVGSPDPIRSPSAQHLRLATEGSLSPLSPSLSRSPAARRRHSISSAAAIVRYVEWTPEDSVTRRRGRLVVESERNVDFASRQADTDHIQIQISCVRSALCDPVCACIEPRGYPQRARPKRSARLPGTRLPLYSWQAARRQVLGGESRSSLEMGWAARILRENFLFMHLVLRLGLGLGS